MPRKIKGEKVTPPLPALHCPFMTMDLVIASCSALGHHYSYGYRILNSNDGITELSLVSGSLHQLFDQVVQLSLLFGLSPLPFWVQLPSWMCALWFHMWNPPITCRTGLPLAPHPAAVQHCGPYRAAPEQLVHTQKPRAPSLRSLLDSCPCLEPLAIFLSPQTLWFCVGYLRVNFPVQSVLMGRHNHSICDNVANKPCQLTKENFKHFLFSLANETA